MRWRCAPAPNSSTWSSCSSFRSVISRRGWSAWTRSCGIRSATSSAANCSTPRCVNSNRTMPRADTRSDGRYVLTRDLATYAITREVEAGRGSPAGGAYLSFQHVPRGRDPQRLRPGGGPARRQWHRSDANAPSRSRRSRITTWAACGSTTRCERRSPGFTPAARRSAAPTAPIAFRATRSPRRFVFGARAGRNAARHAQRQFRRAGPRRPLIPRSICCVARSGATRRIRRRSCRDLQGADGRPCRAVPHRRRNCDRRSAAIARMTSEIGEVPFSSVGRVRSRAGRLARSSQHAAGGAIGRGAGAGAHREPRRASARGSSRSRRRLVASIRSSTLSDDSALNFAAPRRQAGWPPHESIACHSARRARRSTARRQLSRSPSSPASPCSTACARFAARPTRRWRFDSPASMPMPARNA